MRDVRSAVAICLLRATYLRLDTPTTSCPFALLHADSIYPGGERTINNSKRREAGRGVPLSASLQHIEHLSHKLFAAPASPPRYTFCCAA